MTVSRPSAARMTPIWNDFWYQMLYPHRPVGLFDGGQLLGGRLRTLDVLLGHLVGQLEAGEHAADRAGLAAHQQLQRPGRTGIERRMLADDEDRHFPEVGHAFGIDVVQALEVHVAEADDIAELAQLDPIENAAADITRALERVLTAAHHRDRMLAWLELVHQRAVVRVAEQGAADGRWVQVRGVEVDEGVLHLICRGLVDAFALGALERLVDLALGQVQPADRAVAGQVVPGRLFVVIRADGGRFLRDARLALHQPQRHRDVMRRAHDNLVDHHHRDGGTGDRIDGDRILVPRTADHDALVNVDALVLGIEGVQLFFGNADQQNRFMVLEHVGIDDHALGIEQHLHVDRLAGVGGDVHHHVDGLEGIAEDLVSLGDRADLVIALGR